MIAESTITCPRCAHSVAGERLPVLLRLQRLWATPQAEARGLLRVLFLRLGAVPADSGGAARFNERFGIARPTVQIETDD